ncbi:hypothetical protein [Pyxidicoccus caerfyrddinensis]|nr:hypothetical protein [Pyxidicoccus caerfyrddinensis]
MEGDASELECVRVAGRVPRAPSSALAASERAIEGDTAELECLHAAVQSS